jgi:hypothetical protein
VEAILQNETLIVFAAVTVMFVTPWIAYFWHKVRVAEATTALKLEMLRRGMPADKIRMVLDGEETPEPDRKERLAGQIDEDSVGSQGSGRPAASHGLVALALVLASARAMKAARFMARGGCRRNP